MVLNKILKMSRKTARHRLIQKWAEFETQSEENLEPDFRNFVI